MRAVQSLSSIKDALGNQVKGIKVTLDPEAKKSP